MDEELAASLRDAGCEGILLGVESGSDRILARVGKGVTVAQALDVIEMCARHFIVEASFIWGYPDETLADFYDTLIAVLAVHAMGARPKLSLLMPDPASRLAREYRDDIEPALREDVLPLPGRARAFRCRPEVRALVEAHPRLFSAFFHFRSPDFETKCAYIRRHATDTNSGDPASPGRWAWVPEAGGGMSAARGSRTQEADARLPAASANLLHRTVGDGSSCSTFRSSGCSERRPGTIACCKPAATAGVAPAW
jgi:hypothetical protein